MIPTDVMPSYQMFVQIRFRNSAFSPQSSSIALSGKITIKRLNNNVTLHFSLRQNS